MSNKILTFKKFKRECEWYDDDSKGCFNPENESDYPLSYDPYESISYCKEKDCPIKPEDRRRTNIPDWFKEKHKIDYPKSKVKDTWDAYQHGKFNSSCSKKRIK